MPATIATNVKKNKTPNYRRRKGYSQAIVMLTDAKTGKRKDYWLGEYGTPASHEMYHRVLAQWASLGYRFPPTPDNPKQELAAISPVCTVCGKPVPTPSTSCAL